jgi:nicotinamide-nucleotide amidase
LRVVFTPKTGILANMNNSFDDLIPLATALYEQAKAKGLRVGVAESCTSGLVTAALGSVPGVSAVLERGFVVYTPEAKSQMLGVDPALIAQFSPESAEVAKAMAQGVLEYSPVDVALAVTGLAGPTGGLPDKPVGTVFLAVAERASGKVSVYRQQFTGNRQQIRLQAAAYGLNLLLVAVA